MPFHCNRGSPACPDGYQCLCAPGTPCVTPLPDEIESATTFCVKDGEGYPEETPDGSLTPRPDGGGQPRPDSGGQPTADGGQPTPDRGAQPGSPRIVISELMIDPDKANDSNGEYIELFNVGSQPVDIDGWTIKDDGVDKHKINQPAGLVVPAKGWVVLGRNSDSKSNGGVKVDYAYVDMYLSNSADEVQLQDASGKEIDRVTYSPATGFTVPVGASLSVRDPTSDNNNAGNWCAEPNAWSGSSGDRGTPGSSPACL